MTGRPAPSPSSPPLRLLSPLWEFSAMIKLGHTVFALPFVVAAVVLAGGATVPPLTTWLLILVAVAAARTCAMGFNRIADRHLDARNPRTSSRQLPSGRLSLRAALGATAAAGMCFVAAAAALGPLPLLLSPVVLAWLLIYSYTKRFTVLSHLWLGAALGLAPLCAWVAVRGEVTSEPIVPLLLGVAVLLWTAGFDIIYACQDVEVDRRDGLHSLPAALGIRRALGLSALCHLLMLVPLLLLPLQAPRLGLLYVMGLGVVTVLLVYEHLIVRPDDLSRVNVAFFTVNGAVSILLAVALITDHLLS